MSRSSDSGQIEPLAALAATFVVCAGITLYVGALEEVLPDGDREIAPTAADRLVAEASTDGSLRPPLETATDAARPRGHALNATLRTDDDTWTAGPTPTGGVDRVDRWVSVRIAPGRIRPGRLEVRVWREA